MDLIRHALQTAQDHGFAEVEVGLGEDRFQATFQARRTAPKADGTSDKAPPEPVTKTISAPSVGYFRSAKVPLQIGQEVGAGQVVGEILALGLKNEVASKWSGTVVQVLVTPEQPVEYGQPLAVLRLEN